jgi:transposase-like protein
LDGTPHRWDCCIRRRPSHREDFNDAETPEAAAVHRAVYVSKRRNISAARRFFKTALLAHDEPVEVVTDLAQALETVIEEQVPRAFHNTEQYANNRVECDHGRLKSRLRPMRGLKTDRTASVVISGHAFIQNLRRGHYELGTDTTKQRLRIAAAFDELVDLI